ncbi:MAG: hypothetical protein ACYC5K_09400 [Saccharofermentanales bacterium]
MTDHRPKMILFDYGHTLLYEPGFDFLLGEKMLAEHIRSNKHGVTSEQITAFAAKVFAEIGENQPAIAFESIRIHSGFQ